MRTAINEGCRVEEDSYKIRAEQGLCLFAISAVIIKKQKYNMSEVALPENYADRMFELEAILEYQSTIQAIRDLNDLYRAGIDYYIQKDPRKATYLQKKMTSLLANPDNIRILERESKKNTKNQPSPSLCVKQKQSHSTEIQYPALNTRKLKEQVIKFHTVADTCIQNIVENSNKVADKIQRLKRKDLNKQEQNLNDRIMLKRVRSQQKINTLKFKSQSTLPVGLVGDNKHLENASPKGLKNLIQ